MLILIGYRGACCGDLVRLRGDSTERVRDRDDNEIRARRVERTKVVYHKDRDWANPGFQSESKCGYDALKGDN